MTPTIYCIHTPDTPVYVQALGVSPAIVYVVECLQKCAIGWDLVDKLPEPKPFVYKL